MLVAGYFGGDNRQDLAGLAPDGTVWISTDLKSFKPIPGVLQLYSLASGDLNRDGRTDLAGVGPNGLIFYTTDLDHWPWIGLEQYSAIVVDHFSNKLQQDSIAALDKEGNIFFFSTIQASIQPLRFDRNDFMRQKIYPGLRLSSPTWARRYLSAG